MSEFDMRLLLEKKQEEIKRLKEEYMILQNASDEVEEEKDKEIERLNKETEQLRTALNSKETIINELEVFLKEGTELATGCGITKEYIYAYENALDKLKELKGSDK